MPQINLNASARVVLTQAGADVLNAGIDRGAAELRAYLSDEFYEQLRGADPLPYHKAGEVYESQIWRLMREFGAALPNIPMSQINLNASARVVLTQADADILNAEIDASAEILSQMMSSEDYAKHRAKYPLEYHQAGEEYESQIWRLMREFGPALPDRPTMNFEPFFEDNLIEVLGIEVLGAEI